MTRHLKSIIITLLSALLCTTLSAQTKSDGMKYVDLSSFPRLGQAVDESRLESPYDRLPLELKDSIRPELWNLGKNSAGVAIRFRTNSSKLKTRWEVLNNFWMNHMTPTGIKGLDVYGYDDGKWWFVGSGRPGHQKDTFVSTIISNMDTTMREYMLFLPLYDGATKVEIGVDSAAVVEMPVLDSPVREKPVVVYGTSVTQGGCANRPGMAYTSILMRDLNREFINLGFSGNGRLDPEIASIMAETDASVFVLDNMANCTTEMLDRLPKFVEILRAKHPQTPIILMTNQRYTYQRFDRKTENDVYVKNNRLLELYNELKANDPNIYFVELGSMAGTDDEGSIDGAHLTDLGFIRLGESLKPILIPLLPKAE